MAFRSMGPDPVRAAVHNAFEQRDLWPVASTGSERHNQALALWLGYVAVAAGGAAYMLTELGRRELSPTIEAPLSSLRARE